ncbi:MAG: recombination protein O N-terminal domain-containing protein [Akkermansia sp.]
MIEDQATLLRTHPLKETDLIAVWLTSAHGIQRTAVRGALKPKSAFHGCLDLFFLCNIQWVPSKSGDLHSLTGVILLHPRLALRSDYTRLSAAAYFAKLLLLAIEPGTPATGQAHLLNRALAYLEKTTPNQRAIIHFEEELAKINGIYAQGLPAHLALQNAFGHLPKLRQSLLSSLANA